MDKQHHIVRRNLKALDLILTAVCKDSIQKQP